MSVSEVVIQFPEPLDRTLFVARDLHTGALTAEPSATDSFNVSAQGNGSFTGLAYTVPPHATGTIVAKIQTLALTTADITNLNTLIQGMVSASQWQKVRDYQETHASADLSFFGLISGGGSASYTQTHEQMSGFGLSDDNIAKIIDTMAAMAQKMSNVEINFTIDNSANDYQVSGSLLLYTIAGTIQTSNGQAQYRLLANQGTAGQQGAQAPASGNIIPLN